MASRGGLADTRIGRQTDLLDLPLLRSCSFLGMIIPPADAGG